MAKFEKPKGGGGSKGGGNGDRPSKPSLIGKIVEPRCHVCQHKARNQIDYLLAMHTPYTDLEKWFEIDRRSFKSHEEKHLSYEDEAMKRILEHEAGIANENLETGVKGAFLRRSSLDVYIKQFFDALMAGDITVEAKEVAKMIELREKLDANTAATQVEQYELQFNAFKQALEEVCPPEMLQKILDRTKQLLTVGDRPAIQQGD